MKGTCRVCGCTDDNACVTENGACSWVTDDLCNACEESTLYCVGCGEPVAQVHPGQALAIACRCGANAPILYAKDGSWATPFSLIQATGVKPPPHLEYYLGFSEHQSTLKTEVTRMLRALGSISCTECSGESCRQAFERSKAQWERRDGTV